MDALQRRPPTHHGETGGSAAMTGRTKIMAGDDIQLSASLVSATDGFAERNASGVTMISPPPTVNLPGDDEEEFLDSVRRKSEVASHRSSVHWICDVRP